MEDGINMDDWFSEETATFGDRLAAAREAAGMSRKDLAKKLGVKSGSVRNWEDDLSEPRANKVQMLAGILGVSLSWLLSGEGEGIEAPEAEDEGNGSDLQAILTDVRAARAQLLLNAEKMGQLEKRLKAALKDGA